MQCLHKYHLLLWIQWNCLYLYKVILLLHHILVLHDHTKTHILIFYLIMVVKVLNRQYQKYLRFLNFYSQQVFCEKSFTMIIWFDTKQFLLLFLVVSLMSLCFPIFFIVFPKTVLFVKIKKIFFKIIFWFFQKICVHINIWF